MKKIACFVLLLTMALGLAMPVGAATKTGEVQNYKVTVAMRQDGTMDVTNHVEWQVLDNASISEKAPINIEMPNGRVDSLKAISGNISKFNLVKGAGENVLQVYPDKSYGAGQTVSFDYSYHQLRMVYVNKQANTCNYSFLPGWFNSADVKSLTLLWPKDKVNSTDATGTEGNYLTWNTSLDAGQSLLPASIYYDIGVFQIKEENPAKPAPRPYVWIILGVGAVLILAVVLAAVLRGKHRGGPGEGGGHRDKGFFLTALFYGGQQQNGGMQPPNGMHW